MNKFLLTAALLTLSFSFAPSYANAQPEDIPTTSADVGNTTRATDMKRDAVPTNEITEGRAEVNVTTQSDDFDGSPDEDSFQTHDKDLYDADSYIYTDSEEEFEASANGE